MSLVRNEGPFTPGSSVEGDEMLERISELLEYAAHADYVTVMASEAVTQDYAGPDGFREAWSDWLTPYERFRVVFDEVIELDEKLVFLVRQVVTTRHSSVEVETPSASVWWFEDGRIRQAGFYLDRQSGLKAAGMSAPDRPPES